MILRRIIPTVATLACLATASLVAQERATAPSRMAEPPAASGGGPRLQSPYNSYQPTIVQRRTAMTAAAAAADKTTITISTLGLVLLIVLVILLVA